MPQRWSSWWRCRIQADSSRVGPSASQRIQRRPVWLTVSIAQRRDLRRAAMGAVQAPMQTPQLPAQLTPQNLPDSMASKRQAKWVGLVRQHREPDWRMWPLCSKRLAVIVRTIIPASAQVYVSRSPVLLLAGIRRRGEQG